jgi:hypothetical protein
MFRCKVQMGSMEGGSAKEGGSVGGCCDGGLVDDAGCFEEVLAESV